MNFDFSKLLDMLLSVLGRDKPEVERPIKDVIDVICELPPEQMKEPIDLIDIRRAQRMLADAGYDPGPDDGLPGERTRAAVEKYQEDNGLDVDGLIGQKTWRSLQGEA